MAKENNPENKNENTRKLLTQGYSIIQETEQPDQMDQSYAEINVIELFMVLIGHWKVLILALAVGALLGGLYHNMMSKPSYQATASIYMTNSDTLISMSDLQISTVLTEDYANILKSRTVLNKVIADQGLNINYKQLSGMISVENPEDTRILNITVTSSDPQLSRDIANSLINVGIDQIYMIIGTNMPNVIDVASAESVTVTYSSFNKMAIIGAALVFLLVCLVIIVRFLMDTTIKSEDDIEKYLKLPVLGSIPEYSDYKETVSRLTER